MMSSTSLAARPGAGWCAEVVQELAPPDGRRGARGKPVDSLAWYAAVMP